MPKNSLKVTGLLRNNVVRILFFLFIVSWSASTIWAKDFQAAGMAIYDINEGRFLYKKNSQTQRAPASTIKVLTALTAEHCAGDRLDQWVTISEYAASAQPTKASMNPGEKYKLRDLIAITLVASCNDAARAVAEGVSGSEANFVREMQKMADSLGAQNTRITNASGLPSPAGMVTTAEDSVKFIIAASKSDFIKGMLNSSSVNITSSEGRRIPRSTHNRLMKDDFHFPVLGKTGFTNEARHCFLSFCTTDGRSLAISILGEPSSSILWDDLRRAYDGYMKVRSTYFPIYMAKNGISVAQLQEKLKNAGFSVSGESVYGAATRKAVSAFQKSKRLAVDGLVGARTWAALSE